jgi:hypothetical protein
MLFLFILSGIIGARCLNQEQKSFDSSTPFENDDNHNTKHYTPLKGNGLFHQMAVEFANKHAHTFDEENQYVNAVFCCCCC